MDGIHSRINFLKKELSWKGKTEYNRENEMLGVMEETIGMKDRRREKSGTV